MLARKYFTFAMQSLLILNRIPITSVFSRNASLNIRCLCEFSLSEYQAFFSCFKFYFSIRRYLSSMFTSLELYIISIIHGISLYLISLKKKYMLRNLIFIGIVEFYYNSHYSLLQDLKIL